MQPDHQGGREEGEEGEQRRMRGGSVRVGRISGGRTGGESVSE